MNMTKKNIQMQDNIKAIANRYFEGTITPEEEQVLFQYLKQDATHLSAFRQWETEWQSGHFMDERTTLAFANVVNRLQQPAQTDEPAVHTRFITLRRLVAAAAVVLLMVMSGVLTYWLKPNQPAQQYALTAPMGSKTHVLLPDSSEVWLNAGSTLRYASDFNEANRNVSLEGEGYFQVKHKQDGQEFTVHTNGYDVVVKGTRFTVTAYADDPMVTTALLQGSVCINRGQEQVMMTPGQTVKLDRTTGKLTKLTGSDEQNVWTNNGADYGEITLDEFAKILSRQYDVDIDIRSAKLKTTRLSISITSAMKLEDLLQALRQVTGTKIVRHGRHVTIER